MLGGIILWLLTKKMNRNFSIIILSLVVLFSPTLTLGQSGKVPPFRMVQPDGKVFKAEHLPLGKPIILIYFSTECEECHRFIESLLKHADELKGASIAMITYLSLESVIQYAKDFNLNKYNNIFVGTEGNSLFLINYFNINRFPFVALYTKNGDLVVKYYSDKISLEDLLNKMQTI